MTAPRPALVVGALVAASLASGCFSMRTQLPGAVRADLDDEQVIVHGRVDVEVSRVYLFWGLLPLGDDEALALALRDNAVQQGGDGVANLVFDTYFSPVDVMLQTITLGILAPRTYRLRGDVVRIRAAPLPGRRLLDDVARERRRERPSPLPPDDPGAS